MKPCAYCGTALENGAIACSKCERVCDRKVQVNPNLHPAEPYPRYSIWGDLVLAVVLGVLGFYFFGLIGGVAGFAAGAIIAFGI